MFLHADTRLPAEARAALEKAYAEGIVGGGFARRFLGGGWFLRGTAYLTDWRGRWWGWFLGDQAIYVRQEVFKQLNGFPEWKSFEDLEFSRRLTRHGKTRLLQPPITSSARRFQVRGAVHQTWLDFKHTLRYLKNKHPN